MFYIASTSCSTENCFDGPWPSCRVVGFDRELDSNQPAHGEPSAAGACIQLPVDISQILQKFFRISSHIWKMLYLHLFPSNLLGKIPVQRSRESMCAFAVDLHTLNGQLIQWSKPSCRVATPQGPLGRKLPLIQIVRMFTSFWLLVSSFLVIYPHLRWLNVV